MKGEMSAPEQIPGENGSIRADGRLDAERVVVVIRLADLCEFRLEQRFDRVREVRRERQSVLVGNERHHLKVDYVQSEKRS